MKLATSAEAAVPSAAHGRSAAPGISHGVFLSSTGFHASLDSVGAVFGPLLAFGVLSALSGDLGMVFVLALTARSRHFLIFAGVSTLFAAGNSREAFRVLRCGNHDVRQ